jgi:hypothetical protein
MTTSTFLPIEIGTSPNDGTGDPIRSAFNKVNANFETLYQAVFTATSNIPGITFADLRDFDTPNYNTGSIAVTSGPVLVAVNNAGDGMANRLLVGGNGIAVDNPSATNIITIRSIFTASITSTAFTLVQRNSIGQIDGVLSNTFSTSTAATPNTIAARDEYARLFATEFIGTASNAVNAVTAQNATSSTYSQGLWFPNPLGTLILPSTASGTSSAYTVVVRDGDGNIAGAGGGGGGYTGSIGGIGYTGSLGIGYTGSSGTPAPGYTGSSGAGFTGSMGTTGPAGSSSATVVLSVSNPTILVYAYANGVVADFSQAYGYLRVFQGPTDITSNIDVVLSSTSTLCTGTVNTAVNTPVTGPKGYYRVTGIIQTETSAQLTLSVAYPSEFGTSTLTQVVSVNKVEVGYEIVNSLPATNLFEGRIVFYNGQLWRYTSGAWTTAVPATDITGTINSASIALVNAQAVLGELLYANMQAVNLLGTITETQISSDAISSPKIQAGAIVAGKLGVGAVVANTIAAGAITATNLLVNNIITGNLIATATIVASNMAANSITATNIASNSIIADKIEAGAVTAAKISVNSLSALTATMGTVTAGIVQNASGSAKFDLTNGKIVFNNSVYMKVTGIGFGASSNYLEWYGPTVSEASNFVACNDANAIFYLKTDGTAFFGGVTNAPRVTNQYVALSTTTVVEVVPRGVSLAIIELWGGSGTGNGNGDAAGPPTPDYGYYTGGTGGSSGYCVSTVNVTTGAQITFTLPGPVTGNGATGGSSVATATFLTTMYAPGGFAGYSGSNGGGGIGGLAGYSGSGGTDLNLPGTAGATGTTASGGTFGSYQTISSVNGVVGYANRGSDGGIGDNYVISGLRQGGGGKYTIRYF